MPTLQSFDKVWLMHVDFTSSIKGPCSAPFTEVVYYYVPAVSEELEKAWHTFVDNTRANKPKGLHDVASGWMREEVEHENFAAGVKGRAFVALVGWDSPEDHVRYRETEEFKKDILETRKHVKGVQMVSAPIMFNAVLELIIRSSMSPARRSLRLGNLAQTVSGALVLPDWRERLY